MAAMEPKIRTHASQKVKKLEDKNHQMRQQEPSRKDKLVEENVQNMSRSKSTEMTGSPSASTALDKGGSRPENKSGQNCRPQRAASAAVLPHQQALGYKQGL